MSDEALFSCAMSVAPDWDEVPFELHLRAAAYGYAMAMHGAERGLHAGLGFCGPWILLSGRQQSPLNRQALTHPLSLLGTDKCNVRQIHRLDSTLPPYNVE